MDHQLHHTRTKYILSKKGKQATSLGHPDLPFEAQQMLILLEYSEEIGGQTMAEIKDQIKDENKEFEKENGYTNKPFDDVLRDFEKNEELLIKKCFVKPIEPKSRRNLRNLLGLVK